MAKTQAANDNNSSILSRVVDWMQYSSAVGALHRLDDQSLEQMGINRGEIQDFVKSWNDNNSTDAA